MKLFARRPDSRAAKLTRVLAFPLLLALVAGSTAGCGTYVAHRMVQAPNSYPTWLAPHAPVLLSFDHWSTTNFPSQFAEVGPPQARLRYRIVEPADYHFQVTSTNWLKRGKKQFQFNFHADVPGQTNEWTAKPRGTVVLLHGYALAEFAMAPWAVRLAEEGWRCVLVDLRGHGKSTGKKISYGITETQDMRQLSDVLAERGDLVRPVAAMGESYGASLSLRWKAADPRVDAVVAIAPYPVLSNAVLNICHEYAHWMPKAFPRAGLKCLPACLGVEAEELDPLSVITKHPVAALFIAADGDAISPTTDVRRLFEAAGPESKFITVMNGTHETAPYFFDDLSAPVISWLKNGTENNSETKSARRQ